MKEARFIFYALWQAPCARNFYRQRYSVAAKLEVAQAPRDIYLWRVEISRRRLK